MVTIQELTEPYVKIAAVMGGFAVILGAYGSHRTYPKDREQQLRAVFETANRYHFLHTLAMFGLPFSKHPSVVSFIKPDN